MNKIERQIARDAVAVESSKKLDLLLQLCEANLEKLADLNKKIAALEDK